MGKLIICVSIKVGWLLEDEPETLYNSPKSINLNRGKPLSHMAVSLVQLLTNLKVDILSYMSFDLRLRCEQNKVNLKYINPEGTRLDESHKTKFEPNAKKYMEEESKPVIKIECPYIS